ncbi:MAG TPA: hypothetical protein V6D11_08995 [Waterburya sp.]
MSIYSPSLCRGSQGILTGAGVISDVAPSQGKRKARSAQAAARELLQKRWLLTAALQQRSSSGGKVTQPITENCH